MGLKKLSEETISNDFTSDAHLLVAQTEEVDGDEVNVVRRVPAVGEGRPFEFVTAELEDLNAVSQFFTCSTMSYTISDGVAKFQPSSSKSEHNLLNTCDLGSGLHVVGFKFKLRKLGQYASIPSSLTISIGSTSEADEFSYAPVNDEWVNFFAATDKNLVRVMITLSGTGTTGTNYELDVKELYIYDLDGVDPRIADIVMTRQKASYESGTVTYEGAVNNTDLELSHYGRPADAGAVGDALKNLKLITITDPNDDGNIVIELS